MPGIHGKDKDKEMEHYPGHEDDKEMGSMLRPDVQEKMTREELYAMEDVYTTAEKAEARAKEMGGEVIDMTKAQPVGMMDGGKVKKMNMGGVVPGRGGKFKGMR